MHVQPLCSDAVYLLSCVSSNANQLFDSFHLINKASIRLAQVHSQNHISCCRQSTSARGGKSRYKSMRPRQSSMAAAAGRRALAAGVLWLAVAAVAVVALQLDIQPGDTR
jgi:hypothetical protein